MRWYFSRSGETAGPVDEPQIIEWVKAGAWDAMVQAETGGQWMPIAQSPFAAHLPRGKNPPLAQVVAVVVGMLATGGAISLVSDACSGPKTSPVVVPTTPSPAPEPEPEPSPAAPKIVGLGLTRLEAGGKYQDEGYVFKRGDVPVKGFERWLGRAPDNLAILDIIGPPDDVVHVSLTVGVHSDNVMQSTERALVFFKRIAPEWQGGQKWFTKAMNAKGESSTTTRDGVVYKLTKLPSISMVSLSASSAEYAAFEYPHD